MNSKSVRRFFRLWLGLTLAWVVVGGLTVVQQVSSQELGWFTATQFALLDWGPWVLLSPFVVLFAKHFAIDGKNWVRRLPVYLIVAFVTVVMHQSITEFALSRGLIVPPRFHPGPREERVTEKSGASAPKDPEHRPEKPSAIQLVRLRFSAPIFLVIVAATHAVTFHKRSLERERRAVEAEARLTEARLSALQTQMQPHFLFNTLNAVSSLVYSNPESADEMLCELSALLRRVLDVSDRNEVPLSEELGFVDSYLAIQRIRFPDRLRVKHEIEPGLEHMLVPTLILQALVENAIIHGIAPCQEGGEVIIRAGVLNGYCLLEVCNSGEKISADRLAPDGSLLLKERVGLRNTRTRLQAIHGEQQSFGLYARPNGGVCARISLPWRTSS